METNKCYKKNDIYKIFVAGIDFGLKHGVFPKVNIMDVFRKLTPEQNKKVKSVLWTVMVAGFNYGSNLSKVKPNEEELLMVFENLIAGKPLEEGENTYYIIKDEIDKILK